MAGLSRPLQRRLFNLLPNIKCKGQPVSNVQGCIQNGTLCNDHGTCINNKCICNNGYSGVYCQQVDVDSSDNHTVAITVGKYNNEITHLLAFLFDIVEEYVVHYLVSFLLLQE